MVGLLLLILLWTGAAFADGSSSDNSIPLVSFTSINRYEVNTTDFDRVNDVRTFTSEILFSESSLRLNRPLTKDELSDIARTSNQFETFNNIRFSPPGEWPDIDLFYKYKRRDDLQITNFFEPNEFNNVRVNEYGLALQQGWDFGEGQGLIRGTYKHSRVEGTIEFWPDEEEDIDTFEINGALLLPPVSNDRLFVAVTYVDQNIEQTIPKQDRFDRDRTVAAGLFAWGDFGPGELEKVRRDDDPRPAIAIENVFARRFDPRNFKLFGGVVYDVETFGGTDITRKDFFVGTSLPWDAENSPLHVAVQGTVFTYDVDTDSSQDNSQYRTNITAYYQTSDRWMLVVPFRHDLAIDGPTDFENWRLGIETRWNWLIGEQKHRRTDLSAGLEVQNFYNIDKVLGVARLNLAVSF